MSDVRKTIRQASLKIDDIVGSSHTHTHAHARTRILHTHTHTHPNHTHP